MQRRELSINARLAELCKFFGEDVPSEFDASNHALALATIFGQMYDAKLTDDQKAQFVEVYRAQGKNILEQLRGHFATVLENYLVNEFVMRCYPYAFAGDERFNCRVFVTVYRAVEFAAVLTTISRSRLTLEGFLELLCALNDKLDHSKGGMAAIKDFAATNTGERFYSTMIEVMTYEGNS